MSARHLVRHRAPLGTAAHLHDKLFVVTAITNPRRFRTRYEHYNDWVDRWVKLGAEPYTIECAYGDRLHAITDFDNTRHIQLRTRHELWHKENLLNIVTQRVLMDHPEARAIAWVDADTAFVRPDIVNETLQMLQHHKVVQMFSHAQDLGPHYELLGTRESFARSYLTGAPMPGIIAGKVIPGGMGYYGNALAATYEGSSKVDFRHWHPGLAWAWRRDALDEVGGLIDWAIVGAGDFHMAWSLIGQGRFSITRGTHPAYIRRVLEWEAQCERHIHRDVGVVDGTILHYFHGAKANRQYQSRWRIIVENKFDPDTDIKRDAQGVWQLQEPRCARRRALRDGLRRYFTSRNEDDPTV